MKNGEHQTHMLVLKLPGRASVQLHGEC
jgi:hypothetical protein